MYFKLLGLFLSLNCFAFDIPSSPTGRVNDYANVLSSSEINQLSQNLKSIEDITKAQGAIAVLPTLDGQDIESVSNKLFKQWGVGSKERNDGILLVIAMKEHKIRVEVGYGLEPIIPDAQANRFIEEDLKPNLRSGSVYKALNSYTIHLKSVLTKVNKSEAPPIAPVKTEDSDPYFWYVIIGFFLVGITGYYIIYRNEKKREERLRAEQQRIQEEFEEQQRRNRARDAAEIERKLYESRKSSNSTFNTAATIATAATVGFAASQLAKPATSTINEDALRLKRIREDEERRKREEEEEAQRRRRREEESSRSSYSSSSYDSSSSSSSSWGDSFGGFGGGDSGGGGSSGSW